MKMEAWVDGLIVSSYFPPKYLMSLLRLFSIFHRLRLEMVCKLLGHHEHDANTAGRLDFVCTRAHYFNERKGLLMQKLARNMMQSGIDANDKVISDELRGAGINVEHRRLSHRDDPSRSVRGVLTNFTFERHAEKWTALGTLPPAVTIELWSTPVGETVKQISGSGTSSLELWEISHLDGLKLFADLVRKHNL